MGENRGYVGEKIEGMWVKIEGMWVKIEGMWVKNRGYVAENRGYVAENRGYLVKRKPRQLMQGVMRGYVGFRGFLNVLDWTSCNIDYCLGLERPGDRR